jgi:hypothetical protein
MSNDLYDTVNPDHLIDCDPDRMVKRSDSESRFFPVMSFRDLVCHAAAFGWGEGDDNDGNEWCADVLASYVPDMTPAEVTAIMYVVATAAAHGAWGNAKKVTA